ncbi:hypothetical protein AKJ37_06840 [candidate division MSBL1 archaeon SCGC-AAA259I09]|uniref:Uncharacterized protein n=1 Tax=candidate division MSBL1 archaeon SCGC-AAA259I09 TaxID=1698267 RepID=A0A133UME3_9EURY|nr:hypothetical protein AKJ37_06840 [candidate division MSBL1 archaeon SCGC-AAA259I09]
MEKNAVRKAVKYDITIYDASYVSLGEEKGAEVYTRQNSDESLKSHHSIVTVFPNRGFSKY